MKRRRVLRAGRVIVALQAERLRPMEQVRAFVEGSEPVDYLPEDPAPAAPSVRRVVAVPERVVVAEHPAASSARRRSAASVDARGISWRRPDPLPAPYPPANSASTSRAASRPSASSSSARSTAGS